MFAQILASAVPAAAEGGNKFTQVTTKFGIEAGPLVVQIISFAVLALVVWYFGFRPLMKTIAERQAKIAEGLQFSDEITEILHEIMRLDEELKNLEKDEKAEKDVRSEESMQPEDHANSDTVSEYKTEPDQAEKRQIQIGRASCRERV